MGRLLGDTARKYVEQVLLDAAADRAELTSAADAMSRSDTCAKDRWLDSSREHARMRVRASGCGKYSSSVRPLSCGRSGFVQCHSSCSMKTSSMALPELAESPMPHWAPSARGPARDDGPAPASSRLRRRARPGTNCGGMTSATDTYVSAR